MEINDQVRQIHVRFDRLQPGDLFRVDVGEILIKMSCMQSNLRGGKPPCICDVCLHGAVHLATGTVYFCDEAKQVVAVYGVLETHGLEDPVRGNNPEIRSRDVELLSCEPRMAGRAAVFLPPKEHHEDLLDDDRTRKGAWRPPWNQTQWNHIYLWDVKKEVIVNDIENKHPPYPLATHLCTNSSSSPHWPFCGAAGGAGYMFKLTERRDFVTCHACLAKMNSVNRKG